MMLNNRDRGIIMDDSGFISFKMVRRVMRTVRLPTITPNDVINDKQN